MGMRPWGALLSILLLVAVGRAFADDERLQQAAALRDASAEDWKAERYAEAAEKLRQADAIYQSLADAPVKERAITLRALVWNECLSGQIDACGATFERLIETVKDEPDCHGEVRNAWAAIFKAAKQKETFEESEAFLARARYAAQSAEMLEMAAQITHSTASIAREKGELETAVEYLEDAIGRREAIGDQEGLAWSLNNLANLYLVERGDLAEGTKAAVRAHAVVHAECVLDPLPAIATNVRTALAMAHESDGDPDVVLKGIDRLLGQATGSPVADLFSIPWLHRERLSLTQRTGDAKKFQKAAEDLKKAKLAGWPEEVRADLVIVATGAMIRAGKASRAKSWLKHVECGEGPAAAHLRARLETGRALLAAATEKRKDFAALAAGAADCWKELGDWQGERDALAALQAAAKEHGYETEIPEVTARWMSIRGEGRPGGAGGTATSSGGRGSFDDLKPADPLFEITFADGNVVLTDLAKGAASTYQVEWKPRNYCINGLSFGLFGGYVVVHGLDYAGAASAAGAPGAIRLAELGDYLPVPATGALVIQKNGGVRYQR